MAEISPLAVLAATPTPTQLLGSNMLYLCGTDTTAKGLQAQINAGLALFETASAGAGLADLEVSGGGAGNIYVAQLIGCKAIAGPHQSYPPVAGLICVCLEASDPLTLDELVDLEFTNNPEDSYLFFDTATSGNGAKFLCAIVKQPGGG